MDLCRIGRWLFMVDSCLQRMAAVVHLSLHWLESMERITREVKVTFWLSRPHQKKSDIARTEETIVLCPFKM